MTQPVASMTHASLAWRRLPWSILLSLTALVAVGLSAIVRGDELAHAGAFAGRQVVWILLSLPALILAAMFPYRRLRHTAYFWFALSLLLLAIVYIFPPRWGARRWIPIGPLSAQPSELAKLAWIMALARYLMYRENYRRLSGLCIPFVMTLIPLALILKEPDLGTALLFVPVLYAMLFAAGARLKHLALVACLGLFVSPLFWMAMSAEQKSRITAVFQQTDGGPAPRGDGYHLHQSKQVLALGQLVGSQWAGTAVDDPLAYHLPACRTDFVICMVGERWGLIGCLTVLALYLTLFAGGLKAASRTREPFGRLIAVGIIALLATQAIVNSGMAVGLVPITGITLPLLSYGGSSLLMTCVALGIVINVATCPGFDIGKDPFRFAKA
jgi:rod shape determining protein RodA